MLYRDLVLLNNTLDNLATTLRKKLRKMINNGYIDIYTTSDCFIYDFTNKITIGYYVNPETQYYIAYNPFTKHKLLLDPRYIEKIENNITNIVDLDYLIGNLLIGNYVDSYNLQENIYINTHAIKGILLQFLSKFNQIEHNFTSETYFENIYMLYKTLQNNLPKDRLYFYSITDTDYELITENSKLLPFSAIMISTNYNLFNEILDITNYVSEKINSIKFKLLKPLYVTDTVDRFEDDYDIILEYSIHIIFNNEIIMDLIGINILDESIINYI